MRTNRQHTHTQTVHTKMHKYILLYMFKEEDFMNLRERVGYRGKENLEGERGKVCVCGGGVFA